PAGLEETLPWPVPPTVTESWCCSSSKVAVTDLAALIVTLQAPVPVQAPPQPLNSEPGSALGVRSTSLPFSYSSSQSLPQLMPEGELAAVPRPLPGLETVSLNFGTALNSAVTDFAALIVTWQAPVPVQAPLQPLNSEPASGVSVRVTTLP